MSFRPLSTTLVLILSISAAAEDYRGKLNEGYESYKNGEYDKAVENYRQAGIIRPEEPLPDFGRGAGEYRMSNFEGAGREYSAAAGKGTGKMKADAYYNTGNALYKAGHYDQAVKSYIDALRIDPDDRDYKHNLELTLLKQQQQEKQQQQQENKSDDRKNEDQKQENQKSGQQDQKDRDQKSSQDRRDSEQKQSEEQQQSQLPADRERMSEEEAENLLARFAQDEKEVQEELRRFNVGRSAGRDW